MTIPNNLDQVLQAGLTERAAGDPGQLLEDIVRAAERRPHRRSGWAHPTAARMALLASTALVAIAIGSAAIVSLGNPSESGEPSPGASALPPDGRAGRFIRPFTYVFPTGSELTGSGDVHLYRFTGVTGGIDVFNASEGDVHPCPMTDGGPSRIPLADEPLALLEDLQTIGGADVMPADSAMLGGIAARASTINPDANACDFTDIHPTGIGPSVDLEQPGLLIVGDVDGVIVGVWAWADDDASLPEWVAYGRAFAEQMRFTDEPSSQVESGVADNFLAPFAYSLPTDAGLSLHDRSRTSPSEMYSLYGGMSGAADVFIVHPTLFHGCPSRFPAATPRPDGSLGEPLVQLSPDPEQFLIDLHDNAGVGIGAPTSTEVGGLPAFEAEVTPEDADCLGGQMHVNGLGIGGSSDEPLLDGPGRLTVVQVDGMMVGIWIWAEDQATYDVWLPAASAFVASIIFEP
jgi:hypothetical protein